MVKVLDGPVQVIPLASAGAKGPLKPGIVLITKSVAVLITETSLENTLATYTLLPSALDAMVHGELPTGIFDSQLLVAVLTVDTLLDPIFDT